MTRTGCRGRRGIGIAAAAAMLLPGTAAAKTPAEVPPGNSAVNQYTQTFPSAGGPVEVNSLRDQEPVAPAEALGRTAARRLQARGPDGRAAAALAAATAPKGEHVGGRRSAETIGVGSSAPETVLEEALGTASGGKMGPALPLVLLITFVGSALYMWKRRPRAG